MTHPILEPLVTQIPINVLSRKLIEEEKDHEIIIQQLSGEQQLLHYCSSNNDNLSAIKNLEDNGYMDWLKDAENEDFVRMVGLLQLVQETFSALQEDLREDD